MSWHDLGVHQQEKFILTLQKWVQLHKIGHEAEMIKGHGCKNFCASKQSNLYQFLDTALKYWHGTCHVDIDHHHQLLDHNCSLCLELPALQHYPNLFLAAFWQLSCQFELHNNHVPACLMIKKLRGLAVWDCITSSFVQCRVLGLGCCPEI